MARMTLKECIKKAVYSSIPFTAEEYDEEKNYTREGEVHCTSSAFLCNETLDKVLFVYHNIYDSYTWTGGHNDGDRDFLAVAKREAEEETGVKKLTLYSSIPLHVGFLPVKEHRKNGKKVEKHTHLNVTFAFIVSEKEKIRKKEDENSDVKWLPIDKIADYSSEPHMIPVFEDCVRVLKKIQREKQQAFESLPSLLLPWYDKEKRDLPWRKDITPYKTWVSEIMLQQTRVEAGKEYFVRFLKELPTISDLANCSDEKLMKLWEGLGYYNRAKNLKKTAQLVEKTGLPSNVDELQKLPGIGQYTAGAIASIAFGRKEPAVDGNVVRVVSRLTENYSDDLKSSLFAPLKAIYPDRAGDFTQSLMELGALVCLPNGTPSCGKCPLSAVCMANRMGLQLSLPILPPKRERKKEAFFVYHVETPNGIVLEKRKEKGVLHGLWQLPNSREETTFEGMTEVKRKKYTHVFTHVEWEMTCIYLTTDRTDLTAYSREKIEQELSVPSAFKQMFEF